MWCSKCKFFENQSCLELANKELMRRGGKEINAIQYGQAIKVCLKMCVFL